MDLSTIIAGLALLVALVSGVATYRIGSRQNKLQEQFLSIEARRKRQQRLDAESARVSAEILRDGHFQRLIITNAGAAVARHIAVFLDDVPLIEHHLLPQGQDLVRTLAPSGEAGYMMAVTMGAPTLVFCRITWEDESGRPGLWESEMSV